MNVYGWGALIWVFTIVFVCLALYGANKDEQS